MIGIEKITARITAEAKAQANAVRVDGEHKAAAIRAEYEKKAQDEYQALVDAGTRDTEQRVQRLDRTARLEAKKNILTLKQDMLAAAYDRARTMILGLPEENYTAFLAHQAGRAASTGREEVILSAADRARVGEKVVQAANALLVKRGLPGQLVLSAATRPLSGGLVLRQGDIEVNCSLDSLLEMSHGSLDAEVADILFN